MVRAEEIMVKDVAVVHPDDVVTDVVGLFVERNVTSAVVVDEKNTVKGIITDGDIMAAVRRRRPLVVDFFNFIWAAGDEVDLAVKAEALSTMKVKDLMTKQVITVGEDTEILEIARLMAEHKIKQIPVVRGNPVRMEEFASVLGRVLQRPSSLRVPAWVLKMALGEMAALLLTGQRVLPARALQEGYQFRYPELAGALEDLLISSRYERRG